MAEDTTNGATAQPQQPDQAPEAAKLKMKVLGQFVRDMSFENIVVQRGSASTLNPEVAVQVNLDAKKGTNENQYQVITKFNVTSKDKESGATLFVLELDYAGMFEIEGVPEEQLHPFLMIECPRMLFPFVRRIISDVTRDGGFAPLNIDNVDFVNIYRTEVQRRVQAKADEAAQAKSAEAPEEPDAPEKPH